MVRVEIKLLPEDGGDAAVAKANQEAQHGGEHLRYLIGNRKCRKHPSNNNKIRVHAVAGGNPKLEVVSICCTDFYKRLK